MSSSKLKLMLRQWSMSRPSLYPSISKTILNRELHEDDLIFAIIPAKSHNNFFLGQRRLLCGSFWLSCQRKMFSLTRQSPDAGQVAVGVVFLSELGWSWPGPSKHQSHRKMLMPRRPAKRSESLLQPLKRTHMSRSQYSKKEEEGKEGLEKPAFGTSDR